jgi:iron complex transport system substrate-binding protein
VRRTKIIEKTHTRTRAASPVLASGIARAAFGAALVGLAALSPALAADELAKAEKIVSIGGDVTEIVYALGEGERLVARDTTSSFPAEALDLPDVGYMRALSPEGVLSVKPDGILAIDGSGPPQALDVLKAAGVSMVSVHEGYDRQAILDKIVAVGGALGVQDKAASLADKVAGDLDAAVAEARALDRKTKVIFVLSLQGGRVLASGEGTAAAGVLRLAGLTNAIEGFSGYKQISDEAIIAAAPDAILMIDRGEGHAVAPEAVFANPALAQTPAGRDKRLVRMDGLYLLGFGPRTAKAVRDLSAKLAADGL